jgi:hypothetical protein
VLRGSELFRSSIAGGAQRLPLAANFPRASLLNLLCLLNLLSLLL